ncbi:DUF4928 family protein [Specibacter sp. AOP5-B1-6]|uniref:DUF4928 family protein n=1 Tax=Specibacter sp. AOP5-B1-6 TaxID=3457653 RepID=UPI00402BB641
MLDAAFVEQSILNAVNDWYESKRKSNGGMDTNNMTVGLILGDHLKVSFPLDRANYATDSQVKGLSGSRISQILAEHGDPRRFTSEGGRTSRGTLGKADELATQINAAALAAGYDDLDQAEKESVVYGLQAWFVVKIQQDYFGRQLVKAEINPNQPVSVSVNNILADAISRGGHVGGAVAQHLVGAKLALRFPEHEVGNDSYSTADQQTARPGDFSIGNTAFHVTMSPSERLMSQRCKDNLSQGYRPVILVPQNRVVAALQLADNAQLVDQVSVIAIETFVGLNIEEMAFFTSQGVRTGIRALLEKYNERVTLSEPDPSLRIEIPEML